MNNTATEVIESLRKDLMSVQKQRMLLQSYLDLGGNDDFFSINDDNYGNGGKEIIRLYDECIILLEHTLSDSAEGFEISKTFLADKLNFYHITESLASIVMPNVYPRFKKEAI